MLIVSGIRDEHAKNIKPSFNLFVNKKLFKHKADTHSKATIG